MEISLVDPWVRILALIIGLASCFYGYPLFRMFLVAGGIDIWFHLRAIFLSSQSPLSYPS